MAELALDDDQRHAFACHFDGVGVAELAWREASARSGCGGGTSELRTCGRGCPGSALSGAGDHAEQRADGEFEAELEPRLEFLPAPVVHSDLAATPPCHARPVARGHGLDGCFA